MKPQEEVKESTTPCGSPEGGALWNSKTKGLGKNIIGSLLLGSSIAVTTQAQASQQHSRAPSFPQPRKNAQGNRECKTKPIDLTKEEEAMWAKMSPEKQKEWLNERKKQQKEAQEKANQEKKQREEARQKKMRWEKARHDKNRQFDKEFYGRAAKNEERMRIKNTEHMNSLTWH